MKRSRINDIMAEADYILDIGPEAGDPDALGVVGGQPADEGAAAVDHQFAVCAHRVGTDHRQTVVTGLVGHQAPGFVVSQGDGGNRECACGAE